MVDWAKPVLTDLYTDFLNFLKQRDEDLAKMFDGSSSTNIITNTIRWSAANNRFEIWNGTSWAALSSQYAINVDQIGGANLSLLIRKDGVNAWTANQPMGGFRFTGGGDPQAAQDYVTRQYLENQVVAPGTKAVFYQNSAPNGWTIDTTAAGYALRVKNTETGGTKEGTNDLKSTVSLAHSHAVNSHIHTGPSHSHSGPSHTHTIAHTHSTPNHTHTLADGASVGTYDISADFAHDVAKDPLSGEIVRTSGTGLSTAYAPKYSTISSGGGTSGGPSNANTGSGGTGQTGAAGTGNTGSASPGTDSKLADITFKVAHVIIATKNAWV